MDVRLQRRDPAIDAADPALHTNRTPERGRRPRIETLARRVVIERIRPEVDGGRFPIKRTVGESVLIAADIFADGHDVIAGVVRDRHVTGERAIADAGEAVAWRETPLAAGPPGSDEFTAAFTVDAVGWHEYTIVAWVDRFRTWRRELRLKAAAGQDVAIELLEGSLMIRDAATRAAESPPAHPAPPFDDAPVPAAPDAEWLLTQADALSDATPTDERVDVALDDELAAVMLAYADRSAATVSATLRVWVDRERARFGAWYEMFPRSAGPDPSRSGTFREACHRLPAIADLGFDVLYLPPIHPIGHSYRKGPNNSLIARPGDPGSPWAIGSEQGGHTAVDPGLGTLEDFDAFRQQAERLGLEVALDLAWQCSPDHPWVRDHPEWVRHRPDGTIKYAENPPKKYQDIYPLDFANDDWRALWAALLEVTLFWVEHGIRIFRVDNPHTKSFGFWEWLIAEVHEHDPRVIFLSEAFTRPKLMRYLAKAGFTQSYTYFTWRNTAAELRDYFEELTSTDVREYLRPNLFANTPDILHAYLQHGGRPAFEARLLLAGTLGANYGIYSGFELCDGRAVPGTEEYADSEKYQIRKWDWDAPGTIKELVTRVNQIRRRHRALQSDWSLQFHATDNPALLAYTKRSSGDDTVLMVVNLDPFHMQHGFVHLTPDVVRAIAPGPEHAYIARDLLTDTPHIWRGLTNYVRLDPGVNQGHILQLEIR